MILSWFSPILHDSQINLELILIDSWISLNPDSQMILATILADSHWFSNQSEIDSQWFSNNSGTLILDDSRISLNPDSQWFSDKSWILILIDSWISLEPWFSWFLLILNDCHWFSMILMILAHSRWFLNKSGIDSHWFSNKSKPWFSLILADSDDSHDSCQFSMILQISLELILVDSWISLNPDSHWFLPILHDSQWFLPILNDSWISLQLILIDSQISLNPDSHWFLNDSKLPDSHWFSPILEWFLLILK